MELVEAVNKRKTTRGFKTDPVPQEVLKEILENALRAPSWGNTQPWEIIVATGKVLEEIKKEFLNKAAEAASPDLPFPASFPEHIRARLPYARRQQAQDDRDPKEVLKERQEQSSRFYEAPCVIYLLVDREMYRQDGTNSNVYSVFDCGLIAQNIMLLAVPHGLSTTAAAASVRCPDVLRQKLNIPDSKMIVLGIFVGYPDPDHPQFSVYSDRAPFDEMVTWCGD
ncbi:nitroreductase family protein [Chloroflexota bacterium]